MVRAPVDVDAIRRQLEYYFSDSNLPRDKFLRAKTEEDEHGYVPISVLLTFKRLQSLGATSAHVADAVKTSDLLALDDHAASIRRRQPLPEQPLFITRAVFAKGWTPGGPEPTIDDFITLFQPSGNVLSVRIRRWVDESGKHFKGSVFVEMESAEAAERVVAEEYTINVKLENGLETEKQLMIMPVDEYFESKKNDRRSRMRKYKLREERNGDRKPRNSAEETTPGNGLAATERNGHDRKASDENGVVPTGGDRGAEKDAKKREFVPGLVMKFDGFGPEVSREDIRDAFEPHGEVLWVDFRRDDSEGYIRFAQPEMTTTARDAMIESKTEFGGKVPTFVILTDEAEEVYWKQVWQKKDMMIANARKRRREGGRDGRGGKRFRGGRGRGRGSFNSRR